MYPSEVLVEILMGVGRGRCSEEGEKSQCWQQSRSRGILVRKESSKRKKEAQEKRRRTSWNGCLDGSVYTVTSCQMQSEEVLSYDNRSFQGPWSQLCQDNGRGSGNEECGHQCHLEISSPEETSDIIWMEKSPGILGDEENLREKEIMTKNPNKEKGDVAQSPKKIKDKAEMTQARRCL